MKTTRRDFLEKAEEVIETDAAEPLVIAEARTKGKFLFEDRQDVFSLALEAMRMIAKRKNPNINPEEYYVEMKLIKEENGDVE